MPLRSWTSSLKSSAYARSILLLLSRGSIYGLLLRLFRLQHQDPVYYRYQLVLLYNSSCTTEYNDYVQRLSLVAIAIKKITKEKRQGEEGQRITTTTNYYRRTIVTIAY